MLIILNIFVSFSKVVSLEKAVLTVRQLEQE